MAALTNSFSPYLQKRTKPELPGLPYHFTQTLRPGFLLQMARMCCTLAILLQGEDPGKQRKVTAWTSNTRQRWTSRYRKKEKKKLNCDWKTATSK